MRHGVLWAASFLALAAAEISPAEAAQTYNYPYHAKTKITRNPNGQSWVYLEFKWSEACPPNFESGVAVEFEINIRPKCFLQPVGGEDNVTDCEELMGAGNFHLPNSYVASLHRYNCYVDPWNYSSPSALDILPQIEASCGSLDIKGNAMAQGAALVGAFVDPIGTFAVGLHDASALEAGVLYSIRYPVEINDSAECVNGDHPFYVGPYNAGPYPPASNYVDEDLGGVGSHCVEFKDSGGTAPIVEVRNDWGSAFIAMETFNNTCDFDFDLHGDVEYTCPELIGIQSSLGSCENVHKEEGRWLGRLCLPTGDLSFTPGRSEFESAPQCVVAHSADDMADNAICCVDRDNDSFYSDSVGGPTSGETRRYGTRVGDCNDADSTVHPKNCASLQISDVMIAGGGSNPCECTAGACCDGCNYLPENTICATDANQEYGCPDGTSPGDDIGVHFQDQLCSGASASCDGGYGNWKPWYPYADCGPTETCVPGQATCAGAGCECASGGCCNGCDFLPIGTVCDIDADKQYVCPDGPGLGKDVAVEHRDQVCSGAASSCDGGFGPWKAALPHAMCGPTESCVPGLPMCSSQPCACTSGACCDGCNYEPAGNVCQIDAVQQYNCYQGQQPGDDVFVRSRDRTCSGSDNSCNGILGSWKSWAVHHDCASNEVCAPNDQTCNICNDVFTYSTTRACGSTYCFRIVNVTNSQTTVEFSKADNTAFGSWKVYWRMKSNGLTVAQTTNGQCEIWDGKFKVQYDFPTSVLNLASGSNTVLQGDVSVGPTPNACGDGNDAGSRPLSYVCQ